MEAGLASGIGVPSQTCRFLLVPDGSAAQRVRRLIVEQSACSGVVVILKVAAAGGSVTLVGRKTGATTCQFARITVDQSEDLLGEVNGEAPGPPTLTSPEWVASWEEGLQLMDRYPWARLHPVAVHPDFVDRVRAAVEERLAGGPQHRSVERERAQWERLLGRAEAQGPEGDV